MRLRPEGKCSSPKTPRGARQVLGRIAATGRTRGRCATAESGRDWLGDPHPPWPPLCKGGKNDHVFSSGQRGARGTGWAASTPFARGIADRREADGTGWAASTPPGPPFARGGRRDWLGDLHPRLQGKSPTGGKRTGLVGRPPPPLAPPFARGGKMITSFRQDSGERAGLVGRPPPPLAPPLQGGEK